MQLRIEGKKFIEDGGFAGEKIRYEEEEEDKKKQVKFWNESSETAIANRKFLYINLGISIIAIIISIFAYLESCS